MGICEVIGDRGSSLRCFAGLLLAGCMVVASPVYADVSFLGIRIPSQVGRMDTNVIPESSGLVQSLRYSGIFWTLSDSGNKAEIVPITIDGAISPGWGGPVTIEGVSNHDWEDLALDGKGNLIIADTGNNFGRRKDLKIHFVNEPRPGVRSVKPTKTLRVYFEGQKEPSPDYDCEAVFEVGGNIYFLTKHRSDKRTRLFRLAGRSTKKANPLRYVDSFEIGGMVTGADTSPDGKLVAVLTYTGLWVFEYNPKTGTIFDMSVRKITIFAWQAEGVAFDGNDSLVICNEGGQLYRIPLSALGEVRP